MVRTEGDATYSQFCHENHPLKENCAHSNFTRFLLHMYGLHMYI